MLPDVAAEPEARHGEEAPAGIVGRLVVEPPEVGVVPCVPAAEPEIVALFGKVAEQVKEGKLAFGKRTDPRVPVVHFGVDVGRADDVDFQDKTD